MSGRHGRAGAGGQDRLVPSSRLAVNPHADTFRLVTRARLGSTGPLKRGLVYCIADGGGSSFGSRRHLWRPTFRDV